MFVVMIATECAPVAQAGGLGEVIFGLSGELELRGNAVEIIMPKYDCMRCEQIFGLSVAYQDLWVPWYSGSVHCTVWLGWVIHCHDCQTAVVPVLLYEIYQHLGMHNQREYVLWATGLSRPEHFFDDDRLRDNFNHGAINLMKGGIVYSNFITTVSPQHALEATYYDQGMGLGHTLHTHRDKFGGVLNGIDYNAWNPEIDILISSNYTPDT